MKKFSVAKILSLVCLCALLLGAFAFAVSATEDEKVEIVAANVYYGDVYQIMYAVNAPEGTTLKATDSEGNEIKVVPFAEAPTANINGVDCKVYILETGVAAQAIDEVITLTAEYGNKKAVKNYSILQYIYERCQVVEGAELEMLEALLAYAVKADVFFNGTTESFDKYQYVAATGVTANGANIKGMYAPGATPFANIDAIEYDAENYELSITVNGVAMTLDELKALEVDDEAINVVVEIVEIQVEEPVLGSKENPIMVQFYGSMGVVVTVPANTTHYYNAYGISGMILTANDEVLAYEGSNPRMPATFSIANDTDADVEYTLKVAYPAGHMESPTELVIGDNTANIAAGSQGYYFTWTAPADGTFTLTITSEAGWVYVVNNLTSYVYGDTQWSDSDPVVNPAEFTVAAGDEIQIMVNTYDAADMWNTPAGAVTVTAAFEEAAVEMTIEEALAAEVGTKVIVKGTVCEINAPWNDSYGNISVYITDESGAKILCYRMATNVEKGDIITVTGEIGDYSGNQIINATAEKTGHDASYDVTASEVTIEEALELPDGTDVIVTGTVIKINTAWNEGYGNITVTIKDESGKELYLYRLATNVALNDVIKVTGSMATYNGARQTAAGATAEVLGTHECTKYSEATCMALASCVVCGKTTGEKAEHNMVDGVCSVCGYEEGGAEIVYETERFDIAANKGALSGKTISWSSDNFNFLGDQASSSTAIRTSDSDHFRMYQGSTFTISGKDGQKIQSMVVKCSSSDYATALANSLTTAGVTAVADGTSVTFTADVAVDSIAFSLTKQSRVQYFVITYYVD